MNLIESQLVERLKKGEPESYTILYEQYGRKLYNLAYQMCGNKEDADDIVQKTFLQAFSNIHAFREESGIHTWLYAIAKNLCLRLLEKRKKSTFASIEGLIHTVQPKEKEAELSKPEKEYYIRQVKEGCLLGLLRCLPFYQRAAFILHTLLKVSVKDVSAIIDKSETATRLLIHRAKENLRSFLCKNCTYFNPDNPCHCQNLIDFSLKQGWIQQMPATEPLPAPDIAAWQIEKEIGDLKKIILLYNSLEDHEPSENMIHSIREELSKPIYQVFCHQ